MDGREKPCRSVSVEIEQGALITKRSGDARKFAPGGGVLRSRPLALQRRRTRLKRRKQVRCTLPINPASSGELRGRILSPLLDAGAEIVPAREQNGRVAQCVGTGQLLAVGNEREGCFPR